MKKFFTICTIILLSFHAFAQDDMKSDFGITRGRNIHLWPIVYRDKTDSEKRVQVAASLFTYRKNLINNDLHTHLLPFYTYNFNSLKKDVRVGSLYYPSVYRYTNNFISRIQSYKVLEIVPGIDLLEYSRSDNGDYLKNNLLFFLWYKNDKVNDKSEFMVFPLYYYYRNKAESTSSLVPFYFRQANLSNSSTWVFPIFFFKHKTENNNRFTAFPFYFRKRNIDIKNDVVFPFVWRYQRPEHSSLLVMPVFGYGKNNIQHKTFYGFTPFVWNINKPSYNFHFVVPVYWKKNQTLKNDTIHSTVFFPVYFRNKRHVNYINPSLNDSNYHDKNNTTIFPIYWNHHSVTFYDGHFQSSNDYVGVMPFYGKGKRLRAWDSIITYYSNITPIYWHISNVKTDRKFLFPLWWLKHHTDSSSIENHHVLFPLIWHYRKSFEYTNKNKYELKTDVLFPIYWHYHELDGEARYSKAYTNNSTVLFPVFWNLDRSNIHTRSLFPLYRYRYNDATNNFSLYVFPTFLNFKNTSSSQQFLFPFYHSFFNKQYQSKTLFPLFSFGKSKINHNHHLVFTPLFWNIESQKRTTSLFFPLYYHSFYKPSHLQSNLFGLIAYQHFKTDTSNSYQVIWPIVGYKKSATQTAFHLAPIFWLNNTSKANFWGLFPFFYKYKSPEFKSYHFLWQAYTYKKQQGIYSSHHILGPLFSAVNFDNHDYDRRLLYLLYADCKVAGTVTKSVFPIYFHKHDSIGNSSTSVGFAFYNTFKRKIETTNFFYKEVRVLWFLRLRSNAGFLKNKGIEVDRRKLRSES
ncbi:MAG: hypothetical protein WCO28_04210 [Bacteroidota bacterium]